MLKFITIDNRNARREHDVQITRRGYKIWDVRTDIDETHMVVKAQLELGSNVLPVFLTRNAVMVEDYITFAEDVHPFLQKHL